MYAQIPSIAFFSIRAGFQRYFYNTTSDQCEEFTYGGCDGNGNNFETIEHCQGNCSSEITYLMMAPNNVMSILVYEYNYL